MEEDIIKETAESVSLGMGIRVIRGDQTGFGYTNDLSLDKVQTGRPDRGAIAHGRAGGPRPAACGRGRSAGPSTAPTPPAQRGRAPAKIGLVREAYAAARGYDPRIAKVKVHYSDSSKYVCIANSEGLLVRGHPAHGQAGLRRHLREGRQARVRILGRRRAGRAGVFPRRPHAARGSARRRPREAAASCSTPPTLRPAKCPSSSAPGHSGVLIHEAVGHLLEADFNRKKTSIFWNKMGKKVGSQLVTIYDDPTIPASGAPTTSTTRARRRGRRCSSKRASSGACSRTSSRRG